MPFVYSIHDSFASGDAGEVILGIAALLWAIQCVSGGYLTFPLARPGSARSATVAPTRSWVARMAAVMEDPYLWRFQENHLRSSSSGRAVAMDRVVHLRLVRDVVQSPWALPARR